MQNFGFIKSIIDGSEKIFEPSENIELPSEYSCLGNLPNVINQGQYSICVPCSISAYINWRASLEKGEPKDIKVKLFDIYNSRKNSGEGMTFKDAFHYLKHQGVKTSDGIQKIGYYAMIKNPLSLKHAIIENGPCVAALPVYGINYGILPEFWNKNNGAFQGGHAISVVGYNEDGFIIRNSWGNGYGENGYVFLKNSDFHYFFEAWTVVG